MSPNPRKWSVAIKVVNDDAMIEQIRNGTKIMLASLDHLDDSSHEHYEKSGVTPPANHLPQLNAVVPSDDIDKLVLVAQSPARSKNSTQYSPAGVKVQRRRKHSWQRNTKRTAHKENQYYSREIPQESLMVLKNKALDKTVIFPEEQTDISKSPEIWEASTRQHCITTSPADMVTLDNVQATEKLNTNMTLGSRSCVFIQEIKESSSILEIHNLSLYNSNNSSDTEFTNRQSRRHSTQNNLLDAGTQHQIDTSNALQLLHQAQESSPASIFTDTDMSSSKISSLTAFSGETPIQASIKIPELGISCGRTNFEDLLMQKQHTPKSAALLSATGDLISTSKLQKSCMKTIHSSLPEIEVACEQLMVSSSESSTASNAISLCPFMSSIDKTKTVPLTLRKTRSFVCSQKTAEINISSKVVQSSRVVRKRQSRPQLARKFRHALTTLTEKSTPNVTHKSIPVLVKRFPSHYTKKLKTALRKTCMPYSTRQSTLTKSLCNTNNKTSSENDSDEADQVPQNLLSTEELSDLPVNSPKLALQAHFQQKPELTNARFLEHSKSTKRNAVIIPPSEHISFTQHGDVKFSKTIMKTISKLAENNSNQIYVYLNTSTKPSNLSRHQVIFKVDSSSFPFKFIKTSLTDEPIAKHKSWPSFSPKESTKRQESSRRSLKRQSTYNSSLTNDESGLSESANEHLQKDQNIQCTKGVTLSCDEMVTSDGPVSQWTSEDVSQWLISHGLGRFTTDFAGVNGCGLEELIQYFNRDVHILHMYLHDLAFSLSDRLKLYAALRVLHKEKCLLTCAPPTGSSSLTDHTCPAQKKTATVTLQPALVSANGQEISSSPINQWTCENVIRWLVTHGLGRFSKDFSSVDGDCLVELITSCSLNSNSTYMALYSMGFTFSEFLTLSAMLRALSQQGTVGM